MTPAAPVPPTSTTEDDACRLVPNSSRSLAISSRRCPHHHHESVSEPIPRHAAKTELLPPQTVTGGLLVLAASARDAVTVPQSGLRKYFTCGFSHETQPGARLLLDNNTPAPIRARLSHSRLILGARGSQRQYLLPGLGGSQCLASSLLVVTRAHSFVQYLPSTTTPSFESPQLHLRKYTMS